MCPHHRAASCTCRNVAKNIRSLSILRLCSTHGAGFSLCNVFAMEVRETRVGIVSARQPNALNDTEDFDTVNAISAGGPWQRRVLSIGQCGCGSKPMVPFWGGCTTHLILEDAHWGYGISTHGHVLPSRILEEHTILCAAALGSNRRGAAFSACP